MNIIERIKSIKLEIVLLVILVAIGIFLRSYNFSDWLHFEIDQSYDTLLVSPGVENGIANLPLLGPTAGGGRSLRLGPAFYYLEYLSGKLFGNTPPGYAMLVLIFSIFSLPLSYFFFRRYFSRLISFGLLSLYCLSLYMIIYSRFSWSPNILPFLVMLAFYALLRSLSQDEKKKDLWFIIASVVIVITTQIHFNAFFIIPAIVVPLLIISRPRFKLRTWAGVFLVLAVLYLPIVISDIENKGQNLQYFVQKFKGSGNSSNSSQKLVQVINYHASEYFLIITGIDHINGSKLYDYGFNNPEHKSWRVVAIVFLFLSIIILIYNIWKEKDRKRKDFLWLITLWFFISFIYFFSVRRNGLNIYPRFFLIDAPLPFILLGLMLEKIAKIRKVGIFLLLAILTIPLYTNIKGLRQYFSQLSKVSSEQLLVNTEDVFPNTARVTLAQQYAIVDYIESKQKQNGYPVYIEAKHEYEPVFWYHLERQEILFHEKIKSKTTYKEANYFLITFPDKDVRRYSSRFTVAEEKDFGALVVYYLSPKPEAITADKQISPREVTTQKMQIAQIFTWKKLFLPDVNPATEEATQENIEQQEINDVQEDIDQGLTNSDENVNESINNGTDNLE